MAKFMSKVRGGRVRFDPNRILMSGGATGANEMIMFCLADPGDAFLVPTPYYPGYVPFSLFIICVLFIVYMYVSILLTHQMFKNGKEKTGIEKVIFIATMFCVKLLN